MTSSFNLAPTAVDSSNDVFGTVAGENAAHELPIGNGVGGHSGRADDAALAVGHPGAAIERLA